MDWDYPTWWGFTLLALAAFRVWRLIAADTILDGPRERLLRAGDRRTTRGKKLEEFLTCPWCAGFWITLIWWLFWIAWHRWTLVIATPFAINAVIGLIAANSDD